GTKSGAPGTNDRDTTYCDALCNQWDIRRHERCNFEKVEADARANLNNLIVQFAALTLSSAAAAAVLVWATASLGVLGPLAPVLLPLLTTAAVAAAAAVNVNVGEQLAAAVSLSNASRNSRDARAAE